MFVPAGAKPIGLLALCSMRMFIPDVGGRPPTKNTAAQSRALSLTPNDPIITTGHPNCLPQASSSSAQQNESRRKPRGYESEAVRHALPHEMSHAYNPRPASARLWLSLGQQ